MTKRMLSLLLALVMTLSLCVPALAADEFEAETVTEVEEQAPEAPVEPEAPEAEVVEEPVAEEEPVEAPEVAAALVEEEEEDLPLLVALGIVTKEAHYRLDNDIKEAEKLLPAVQAGKLRSVSFDLDEATLSELFELYADDPANNDPFENATGNVEDEEDFESVLTEAKEYLTGIDGTPVDVTVNTAGVEGAAAALEAFLPGGDDELVDDIYTITGEKMDYLTVTGLGKMITDKWNASYTDKHSMGSSITSTLNVASGTATAKTWQKCYQPEYLAALQKAINAYLALAAKYEVTYAEYVDAVELALDALVMEAKASKPDTDDMTRVNTAISTDPGKIVYEATKYVLPKDGTNGTWEEFNSQTSSSKGALGAVKYLKQDQTVGTVQFKPEIMLWDVNYAIDNLKNHLQKVEAPTIKVVSSAGYTDDTSVTVKFSVKDYPGSSAATEAVDGHRYGVAWRIESPEYEAWYLDSAKKWGVEYDSATNGEATPPDGAVVPLMSDGIAGTTWTEGTGIYTATATLANITRSDNGALGEEDVVHVYVYEDVSDDASGEWKLLNVKETILIKDKPDDGLAWPKKLGTIGYTAADTKWVVTGFAKTANLIDDDSARNALLTPASEPESGAKITFTPDADLTAASDGYKDYNIYFAVMDSSGKTVFTEELPGGALHVNYSTSLTLTGNHDSLLKAGTYTLELRARLKTETNENKYIAPVKGTFTIKPLLKWDATDEDGDYVDYVRTIIAGAKRLVETDYTVSAGMGKELAGSTTEEKVAGAFDLIEADIKAVEALFNDKTAGSTMTNHNKICHAVNDSVNSIGDMLKVCSELEKKPAVITTLAEQLTAAEKLVGKSSVTEDEGTGKYTWNTYGKLKEDMKAAEKVLAKQTGAYQSEVDKAADTLKADIAALDEIASIDKTGLEASIKAAEALKETDYTAATWAAVKTALDSAKEVLAKANPTQAELTNAAKVLDAAVTALVMTDEAKAAKELADAKAALDEVVKAAEALKEADYTAESWKTFKDALDAAKALGDSATKTDVEAAQKALEAAEKALEKKPAEPEKPTIPAAPASGTGWVKATDGTWYHYTNKALDKSKWIYGKGGLWYYVDANAKMLTGFQKIGNAYFMLQTSDKGGVQGKLLSGWITDSGVPGGEAYARTDRNSGHFGEITWTKAYGDFVNGHFTKGDPAA